VTNVGSDRHQLANMARQARDEMAIETLDAVADRGYYDGEEIRVCEETGITVTLPRPLTSGAKAAGRFGKQDFIYVAAEDIYRCPAGERLTYRFTGCEDGKMLRRYWTTACQTCALKAQCTTGAERRIAVLSGPTFAREVGAGLPTAMTVASPDAPYAEALAAELSSANFRAYTSTDIMGVEIGGAVKNALAVGAGLSDGLGFGANTRVALITRGLKEMTRLGVVLGAHRDTFMGLAGLGDLVLTCTDDQSRNRRFGLLLAAGRSVPAALAEIGQAVEGYAAARAIHEVAAAAKVEMPLCEMVYRVLYQDLPAKEAVRSLMSRPIKAEAD